MARRRTYKRDSLGSALDAAAKMLHAEPLYVYRLQDGYSIKTLPPADPQDHYIVIPDDNGQLVSMMLARFDHQRGTWDYR